MIRVLIVDDDKLVRRGLASAMPWEEFSMDVVGEANNGENALKFMEEHPIDLLITDLSMPVMSGIELMRIVRVKYPHVPIVVLTLHQDFEYVQEALRLGAIDYIAKIQLEQEQFEAVLCRVVTLMEQKESRGIAGSSDWEQTDERFVLYAMDSSDEELKTRHGVPDLALEVDSGIWSWTGGRRGCADSDMNAALVCIRGLGRLDRNSVVQLIRAYQKFHLFYNFDPALACHFVNAKDIQHSDTLLSGDKHDLVLGMWMSADWIYHDDVFRTMAFELKALQLQPARLARMFYSITDAWNRLYEQILEKSIEMDDFFASWYHFEQWLVEIRTTIRQANVKPLLSEEIQSSILKAIQLAHLHLSEPISAAEIAHSVNMSSSYFSQCFKQYTGLTYTDYVRDLRMERAKEYLRNTTKTIQWIAERIGYNDEKYFSRLFREQVGMLPSEYRLIQSERG